MRIVFFIFIIAVAACSNTQSHNNTSSDSTKSNIDSGNSARETDKTDFTNDSVITIKFPTDSSAITLDGRLDGINKPVSVIIPISKGTRLGVLLVPHDSVANLRINQVFMPDGKADGPFARTLDRKITQAGNYRLIIGENLMQGDDWKRKFKLTVKVE